jgi:hypothetical protein
MDHRFQFFRTMDLNSMDQGIYIKVYMSMSPYPHYQRVQESKMQCIGIKDPRQLYYQYMRDDPGFLEFIDQRNDFGKDEKDYFTQNSNQKIRRFRCVCQGVTFIINQIQGHNGYDMLISREDSDTSYLHIATNTKHGLACVQNVNYHNQAQTRRYIYIGLERPGDGSKLFRICVRFLKDNKNRYNVNRILLRDNSCFFDQHNNKEINYALMHTLLYGDTWYGSSFGFRPYDQMNDTEDDVMIKMFENNRKVMNTTKTSYTNLYNLIYKAMRKRDSGDGKHIKQKVDEYYAKYHDKTLDVFFRNFLKDQDDACAIFSDIYINLCTGAYIYDLSGNSFYLDV